MPSDSRTPVLAPARRFAASRALRAREPALKLRCEFGSRLIDGGFRLVPVTLVAEDQDHVVVSGPISDKDEVAIGGISALRGMLSGLGQ